MIYLTRPLSGRQMVRTVFDGGSNIVMALLFQGDCMLALLKLAPYLPICPTDWAPLRKSKANKLGEIATMFIFPSCQTLYGDGSRILIGYEILFLDTKSTFTKFAT